MVRESFMFLFHNASIHAWARTYIYTHSMHRYFVCCFCPCQQHWFLSVLSCVLAFGFPLFVVSFKIKTDNDGTTKTTATIMHLNLYAHIHSAFDFRTRILGAADLRMPLFVPVVWLCFCPSCTTSIGHIYLTINPGRHAIKMVPTPTAAVHQHSNCFGCTSPFHMHRIHYQILFHLHVAAVRKPKNKTKHKFSLWSFYTLVSTRCMNKKCESESYRVSFYVFIVRYLSCILRFHCCRIRLLIWWEKNWIDRKNCVYQEKGLPSNQACAEGDFRWFRYFGNIS